MSSLLLKSDAQLSQARQAVQAYRNFSKLSTNFPGSIWNCCGAANPCRGTLPSMRLRQFGAYVRKVFHLHRLAGRISDSRCEPLIPTSAIWLGLVFGAVFRLPAFCNSKVRRAGKRGETRGYAKPISDDALAYATGADASGTLAGSVWPPPTAAQGQQGFRAHQMSGLLALNLDANEHFKTEAVAVRSACSGRSRL